MTRSSLPRVLVVGAGGLGSPAALYLAASGAASITLVDFDTVDATNLQRQVLFSMADVGASKLEVAARRLRGINPQLDLHLVQARFDVSNAAELVDAADVVIDGTDNFATRYLVNDASVLAGKPNVFGSVAQFEGQVSVFGVLGGPCYRCLHPEPPPDGLIPTCAEGGVLGVLPGFIGTIQAIEALKLVNGTGRSLVGRLLIYDALRMRIRDIELPRDPECALCGDAPTIRTLVAYEQVCLPEEPGELITVDELRAWRASGRAHILIDVREPSEHAVGSIDGAILIPLRALTERTARLSRVQPIVVHCKSGGRSGRAALKLRALGYDARSLAGGLDAWKAASLVPEQV